MVEPAEDMERLPGARESEHGPWLALARVRGLGCASFKKVADFFGDPARALGASREALAQIPGLDRDAIEGLVSFSEWDEVRKELRRAAQADATIAPYTARSYPARLRMIADPPPFLYLKGELREDERAVAVVGSRSASDYGLRVTQELCQGLASLGFTVVSGMARGIDAAAHEVLRVDLARLHRLLLPRLASGPGRRRRGLGERLGRPRPGHEQRGGVLAEGARARRGAGAPAADRRVVEDDLHLVGRRARALRVGEEQRASGRSLCR